MKNKYFQQKIHRIHTKKAEYVRKTHIFRLNYSNMPPPDFVNAYPKIHP